MGTAERRNLIMKILCRRRHETIKNLAFEFGVSERTIRRDVETLSLTEPIYTQSGRYGGGVYVVEGYTVGNMYMADNELFVLKKLCDYVSSQEECILTRQELNVLQDIVKNYSKPKI